MHDAPLHSTAQHVSQEHGQLPGRAPTRNLERHRTHHVSAGGSPARCLTRSSYTTERCRARGRFPGSASRLPIEHRQSCVALWNARQGTVHAALCWRGYVGTGHGLTEALRPQPHPQAAPRRSGARRPAQTMCEGTACGTVAVKAEHGTGRGGGGFTPAEGPRYHLDCRSCPAARRPTAARPTPAPPAPPLHRRPRTVVSLWCGFTWHKQQSHSRHRRGLCAPGHWPT